MRNDPASELRGVVLQKEARSLDVSRRAIVSGMAVFAGAAASSISFPGSAKAVNPNGCANSGNQPVGCCFLAGALIATPNGEVPVEQLRIGDRVSTASDRVTSVRWIWRNTFSRAAGEQWFWKHVPIKFVRGSLGADFPKHDLYLSRGHSLLIDGVLVAAEQLVNGVTITRCVGFEPDLIEYFHIELDCHDIVLANGIATESLCAGENRRLYDNFDDYVRLYGPNLVSQIPCAPQVGNLGGRDELKSCLRSMISPIYDVRGPLEIIRDELTARAHRLAAA